VATRVCARVQAVVSRMLLATDVSELVRKHVFFIADSLVVTHVEFPTFLSFESETCRVSGIWETRG